MRNWIEKLKHLDVTLAVVCLLLLLVGLTVIYSTSLSGSRSEFTKQLAYAAVGVVLFFGFATFDLHAVTRAARYVYVLLVVMLVAILRIGTDVQGSRRWFNFGILNFQPAELMKIVVVLVLARFFALRRGEINSWKNILISLAYVLVPVLLIAKEPDLGSAIILCATWAGVLLLSNVDKRVFVYLFLACTVLSFGVWNFALHDYQRGRVETFINPSLDPRGRGYNVQQAIISVGSGSLFGRGLGKGLQSQLQFLPERQTDFVFAAAAEELGFFGSVLILVLYFLVLYRLLVIYQQSRDDTARFAVAGVFFMIFSQAVINVGMNVGVLPVTGIPLPLVSYGGSSLLTTMIALGIAESAAVQSKGLRLG
jgi:rod shape determining protein RodA